MPNFLHDGIALPATKVDYVPLMVGQQIINYSTASDWNAVFDALSDIRSELTYWKCIGITANYAVQAADYAVYANATGLTVTLPLGATGMLFLVKDVTGASNPNTTIATTSGQLIDGA